ncbi:MAG: hypothetical protein JSU74_11365 [Candidatus Zixiibacteriota bacterium]|nr:MAG: hypothetical protein JSU74_11365 [candidate division Zixibacteria bacterium]
MQRTIVDTVRGDDNALIYKAQWGTMDFPPNSYIFEYYRWSDSGLFRYVCGIDDTCKDNSGNPIDPLKQLLIKSPALSGEFWDRSPDGFASDSWGLSMIESLYVDCIGIDSTDTIFMWAAQVTNTDINNNDTITTYEYYCRDFGLSRRYVLTGTDTTFRLNLLEYNIAE